MTSTDKPQEQLTHHVGNSGERHGLPLCRREYCGADPTDLEAMGLILPAPPPAAPETPIERLRYLTGRGFMRADVRDVTKALVDTIEDLYRQVAEQRQQIAEQREWIESAKRGVWTSE
jgi:hypothetical protein